MKTILTSPELLTNNFLRDIYFPQIFMKHKFKEIRFLFEVQINGVGLI